MLSFIALHDHKISGYVGCPPDVINLGIIYGRGDFGTAASTLNWIIGTIDRDQMQNLAIRWK
jgi:hypothetical protein